ncbi:MAG: triose-phosphate isomerase [Candidatus Heimdallarchaeota archaeon]
MKEIKVPLIVLNLKIYPKALGKQGLELAKIAESVAQESGAMIVVCPPITHLTQFAEQLEIPVFSQTVDNVSTGSHTGKISTEMINVSGASGSLINHSENKMHLADIEGVIRDLRSYRLYTVVCTNNEAVSAASAKLNPDAIAFEPPELIGTGVSVSAAQPEIVKNNVKRILLENPQVTPLCGAGISNAEDVKKALELGTRGVLLASAYVKAKDPHALLSKMAQTLLQ